MRIPEKKYFTDGNRCASSHRQKVSLSSLGVSSLENFLPLIPSMGDFISQPRLGGTGNGQFFIQLSILTTLGESFPSFL
jgi:hypothetical protein